MHAARHLLPKSLTFLALLLLADPAFAQVQPSSARNVTQSGEWNVRHISTAVHIAGITRPVDVNCISGCSSSPTAGTQPHITSVTHIAGRVMLSNIAGTAVTVTGTALDVNCIGCTGGSSDSVNVFHQSTVRHVSSVSHVAGVIVGFGKQATDLVDLANTALRVSAVAGTLGATQSGEWNIRHISSVLHMTGTVSLVSRAGVYVGLTGTSLDVNCTGGCTGGSGDAVNVFHQSTVAHVSSVTHVYGRFMLVNQAGTYATFTGAALNVSCANCTGGTSDAVNVFHQSTIAHISSVSHVYGRMMLVNQAGTYAVFSGTALTVSVVNPSPTDAVNVFHQSTIRHVSSVTHIAGGVSLVSQAGVYAAFTGTALNVSCTNCTGGVSDAVNVFHQSTVTHVSSVTHVYGRMMLVSQSGVYAAFSGTALSVNCANCTGGTSDAVNVFHQSTIAHVSSVSHIYGTVMLRSQAGVYASFTGTAINVSGSGTAGTPAGGVLSIQGVSGMTPLRVDQNALPWTIGHITSVMHVAGRVSLVSQAGVYVTVTGTALDVNCTGCSSSSVVNVGHISTALHIAGVVTNREHSSGAFRAYRIANCGTTAATVVTTNLYRRDLYIQNLGGPGVSGTVHGNVYLGYGTQGHVALTINNGWVLHSMGFIGGGTQPLGGPSAQIIMNNYVGPVRCIAGSPGVQLSILEILR